MDITKAAAFFITFAAKKKRDARNKESDERTYYAVAVQLGYADHGHFVYPNGI